MRILFFVLLLCAPATAAPLDDAQKSAILHMTLAIDCERILQQPGLFDAAKTFSEHVLSAAGMTVDQVINRVDAYEAKLRTLAPKEYPPTFCRTMLKDLERG